MNLRELVGKRVVRTEPVLLHIGGGFGLYGRETEYSYRFCDLRESVMVVDVVNDIPIIESDSILNGREVEGIPRRFDDDNWKDVTDAYEYVKKVNEEIKKEKESKEKEK